MNDRLAVLRQDPRASMTSTNSTCKSERPLSGLETGWRLGGGAWGIALAKVNDRLAVWRQRRDPETSRALFLAKVNDRLAVWRLFYIGITSFFISSCKSERPLSGLETLLAREVGRYTYPLAKVNDRLAVWRLWNDLFCPSNS